MSDRLFTARRDVHDDASMDLTNGKARFGIGENILRDGSLSISFFCVPAPVPALVLGLALAVGCEQARWDVEGNNTIKREGEHYAACVCNQLWRRQLKHREYSTVAIM